MEAALRAQPPAHLQVEALLALANLHAEQVLPLQLYRCATDLSAKTREKVKKESVTKIHGQPLHMDITQLEEELVQIAVIIPT